MYLTILTQGAVFAATLALPTEEKESVAEPLAIDALSVGLVSKILCYIGAFTLSSCFKIYIDLVLIERKDMVGENEGMLHAVLDKISFAFYAISYIIVKMMNKITNKVMIQTQTNRDIAHHGYLEGITRIIGAALSIPLVKIASRSYVYTETLCVVSWCMQVFGMVAMKKSRTIVGGYAAYLLSFIGSSITLYISYNSINTLSNNKIVTIMSYVSGISCGAHAVIDFIARKQKIKPQQRFVLYAKLGTLLFLCSGIFSCINYYHIWHSKSR